MKKLYAAAAVLFLIAAAGCSTVDRNVKARKDLQRCRFDFTGLEFNKINHGENGPASIDLTAVLTITNPNESDVVLDHVSADLYIEKNKIGTVLHKNFVCIKAGSSGTEKIAVNIPFAANWLLTGKRPEILTVDAVVYVNIIIGSYTLTTAIPVPVKKDIPVPWDKIDKEIQSQTRKIPGAVKKLLKK